MAIFPRECPGVRNRTRSSTTEHPKGREGKLAEAHGNRIHLRTPSRPHTGFEARGAPPVSLALPLVNVYKCTGIREGDSG